MTSLPVHRTEESPDLAGADPHAGVRVFSEYRGEIDVACDVLVVGSGPGGAVVAKELAEAGRDVVLLEEGPPFGKKDFTQEAGLAMQRMLREGGTRAARGNMFVPTMQANALGGGSLINSAICARPPDWVWDKWAAASGIELDAAEMAPHFERVEKFLFVGPTPAEVQGERNLRFKIGCDKLGLSSEPTWRNVKGCKGSGECFTGCRNDAKKSTDTSYVPAAIRGGARVYTSIRAERVVADGRRVVAVHGHVVEPFTGKESHAVRVRPKVVVLAAGCMQTPVILQKSEVALESGWVGKRLLMHPGLAVMAVYPDPIDPWKGATQGYHSLHLLKEGLKLEVLWSPPAVLAARLPGLGTDYQRHLRTYDRMAPFDVIVACEKSFGSVRAKRGSFDPDIKFDFHDDDVKNIQRGVALLSDICWASGATAVLPGIHGVPEVLESPAESEVLRTMKLKGSDTITAANHAFASTRMSKSASEGVVNEDGRCHGMDNLFIADTGIFASSPAVNPMLTVMALADRIAARILEA
ncbi:MAG TPA: GMC family oxidoreductase [Polyangiaceae bacterium]|nr:GMC family oxidoreductase [Polyangiaceae bacterium]